ncbi:putative nuclease HARBI1 [Onthophagus taurus]|uniref:putative nuclease HARBI1 n=1 Tax=Onthophagus taurus TaxID=166361 RepID=UPI0039BDFCA6
MLLSVADFIGVSKASACRIVKKVTSAIASLSPRYVKMYSTNAEMNRAAEEFYRFARFPRVIGAIDCTLIKIQSPGREDDGIYRSRKGFCALNVQRVSDARLKIRNIVARWPGSCHDQTIFNNSSLKEAFQNGMYGRYMLVGDSGYKIKPYLMTPLQQVQTPAENLYNESSIRTRNVVERQYGVWKRRFPILSLCMRLQIETTMNVIVATAVLHNMAIDMNDSIPGEWTNPFNADEDEIEQDDDHYVESSTLSR